MKKILALISLLFLLTGCTVNYHVTINEDLSVLEEVKIYENEDFYDMYYKTSKSNALKTFLDEYKDDLEKNNYEYEIIKDTNPYVILRKKYKTMEEYLQNGKLFNDYFDEINYHKDGDIVKITTNGFNPMDDDVPERFYIDNLEIAITSSYKVINHNATRISKDTNTFYYEIDDNTEEFSIILEYDTSKKFNANHDLYVVMMILIGITVASWIFIIINKKKKI